MCWAVSHRWLPSASYGRLLIALTATLLVQFATPPPHAQAHAPRLDKKTETALLSPSKRAAGDMVGTWIHDKVGLGLKKTGPERNATWLAKAPNLGDAFVRFRIEGVRPKHFAVLLRATPHTNTGGAVDPSRVSGYQLALRGDNLSWMRRDDGVLRPMGVGTKIRGLRRKRSVEVGVWMIGTHLMAQVYNGKTLEGMGGVSMSDTRYTSGRIGLFTYARSASRARVTWIGYAKSGVKQQGRADAPAGSRRYADVKRADLKALPRSLRQRVRVLERGANGQLRIRTKPASYERLRRRGVVGKPLAIDTPFRYYDPRFLAARKAWKRGQPPSTLGSYMDPDMVEDALRVWAKKHPKITQLVELGRSRLGRPILALRIGKRNHRKPGVLLNAAHHGDELMSILYVMDAAETILNNYKTDEETATFLNGVDLWCVPLVNPDGVDTFIKHSTYTGRKNRRPAEGLSAVMDGVDLNRNYPFRWGGLGTRGSSTEPHSMYYRGDKPGSEPETQAIMRLVEQERFVASISYHTWGTVILTPYTIDGVRNLKPDDAQPVAALMAEETPRQRNGRRFRVRRKIYAVDGTDQDWMRAAHGVVALLVEGPTHNPTWPARRVADVELVRATWQSLLRRVVHGPTLTGRVRDKAGNPVAAEIRIDGIVPPNNERWTTRCGDGRFARLLPAAGVHRVSVRINGGTRVERRVLVEEGATAHVELVVPEGSPPTDCPDPALCSIEARCEATLGRCSRATKPRWCSIGGACVLRGHVGPRPACACRPERDAFRYTTPDGRACAPIMASQPTAPRAAVTSTQVRSPAKMHGEAPAHAMKRSPGVSTLALPGAATSHTTGNRQ